MKIRSGKITPWLAALVCLTLAPGTKATDETDRPEAPTSQKVCPDTQAGEHHMREGEMRTHTSGATGPEAMRTEGAPTKCNKASGVLGMDVRNQKDEHLGHIKDLVIDWKTEQVSYAVISTGSKALLGAGGKLLAVPLAALTASPDRDHLVLSADKEKVAAATGFDADNWPSVSKPSWGAEPFWQTEAGKSVIPIQSPKDAEVRPSINPETDPETAPDMEEESHSHSESESDADMEQEHEAEGEMESSPDASAEAR